MIPNSDNRFLNLVCLMAVNLLWAAQYPAYKIASEHMGVATINVWTLLIASLITIPFVVRQVRRIPKQPRVWWQFIVLGLFGIVPPSVMLAWGVAHSTSANAAILSMTIPVLMSLMGVLMLKERLTAIRMVSLVLALAGTVLISRSDLKHGSFRRDLLVGNGVIFLAGAGAAFYNTYSKKLLETFRGVEVLLYGYITAVVACVTIAFLTREHSFYDFRAYPASAWMSVAFLGSLSWGVAMLLWMWVLNRIEVSQASVSIYMLSVFGVILSALTLHEHIGMVQIYGGLFVVIATVLATEFDHASTRRKENIANGISK